MRPNFRVDFFLVRKFFEGISYVKLKVSSIFWWTFFLVRFNFKGISYVKFKAIFFWFQKFFKGISYIKFIPLLVLHVLRLGDFNFWRNWRKVKFKGISLKKGSYRVLSRPRYRPPALLVMDESEKKVKKKSEVMGFWSFIFFQFQICWRGCYG